MRQRPLVRMFATVVLVSGLLVGGISLLNAGLATATTPATPIYLDPSYSPAERAADLVSRMTTAEKAAQMNSSKPPAIPRLGVAAWGWWNEANHGINAMTLNATGNASTLTNTTSYPSDLAMGSTWNPDLVYAEAQQIGAEARDVAPGNTENLDFYAPTVNLARDPRWGRNDESWGEDPTLVANLASQYVDGLQGENQQGQLPASANGYYQALATLKHYAANNSEVNRLNGNSVMSQKQLREFYTAQFASIIQQSHPGSIMSSYNEVNGTPAAASVQLIDTLARETFGFNGYFTSDCDAVYEEQAGHNWIPPNTTTAVNRYTRAAYSVSAGEDLDCNAGYNDGNSYGNSIPTALTQNIQTLTDTFNIGDVDTSLVRLFTARIETGEFDAQAQVPWVAAARQRLGGVTWVSSNSNNAITETPDRLAQAQASADQSIVLLQNRAPSGSTSPLLPLNIPHSGSYKLLVLGNFAHPSSLFLGGYSSIQGSAGQANNIDSYNGIKAAVQAIDPSAQVDFMKGFTGTGTSASNCCGTVDSTAVNAASGYDAVVVVAGTDSSTGQEAQDRSNILLPGAQSSLISQVEAKNPNTIVYMETMGEVDTSGFQSTTPALVWSSYNGQRQGAALADVLTGAVNPSGHLPFTWYANINQVPPVTDYNITPTATTDGRTYMYFTGDVTWPFGYGQSYTSFSYANLHVNSSSLDANGTLTVSADVTNTGTVTGRAVPQLYVTTPFEPASAQDPVKRLEASQKISLDPGQTKTVTFTVPVSKLAFYNSTSNTFVVDNGTYGLEVSTSAADSDIQLQTTVNITGTLLETPTVVTAKPIEAGDIANGVAQRVMFDDNTTINPQLTVAMSDQQLYGYITKGQSTALPAGLTVSYASDHPGVVSVGADQTLHTIASGVATITATVTYNGASASGTFVVDVAPLAITSNPAATFTQNVAGTYTVTSFGMPTASLSESGTLPAGLTFTDNGDGTATLAGTTTAPTGTYPITITAHNGVSPDATQSFVITVSTPPTITSPASSTFIIGSSHTVTITTSGYPTATLTESGTLPSGITFHNNGDGTATLSGTAANGADGQYTVTITANNGTSPNATQSQVITVLAHAATPTTAVLAGRITDATAGSSISGACVYVYPAGSSGAAAYASCSRSNGSYEIDGVAPGTYNIAFVDPTSAHTTQWYTGVAGGAGSQSGAAAVTLNGGQLLTGVNAALAKVPTGNVTGTVTEAGTGAQLGNVCVYLYPAGVSTAASYASCTAANGTYTVSGVTAGNYNVAFVDPSGAHVTQWYTGNAGGAASQSGAKSVAVSNGNATVTGVNAALAVVAAGNVTGSVTDPGGAGVGNVCVYLYPAGSSSAASYATCTGSNGGYSLGGVAPGAYNVAFYDPQGRFLTQWYNGSAGGAGTQASASAVTVPNANGTASGINAAETSVPTGNVSGTISDATSGNPVAGDCIYLYPHGTSSSASYATCSAADGTYRISGVTAGNYDVAFADPQGRYTTQWYNNTAGGASGQAGAVAVSVPNGNGTASGINAVASLVPTGNVSGTVTDVATGNPVGNVCVYLYPAGSNTSALYATCTQGDGTYTLTGVAAGAYNAAFYDPQGRYTTQWFSAAATQATSQVLNVPNGGQTLAGVSAALSAVPAGNISGSVTAAATGNPLANICVYLYPVGGSAPAYSTCTLADGTYAIHAVTPGTYDVAFYDPYGGYATQWYQGASSQAAAQVVTIQNGNQTTSGVNAALAPPGS